MRTVIGAVVGALALSAVLVSYGLGEHHAFSQDLSAMPAGAYQMPNPYLVQASQGGYVSPYAAPMTAQYPYGYTTPEGDPVPQFVNQPMVAPHPLVHRAPPRGVYASERVTKPARSWQKSALLISASSAGGAGVGALMGGNK